MIHLFLATGFEELEAVGTIDVLRRAEIEVTTVSITDEHAVVGAHNIPVVADKLFAEVDFSGSQMLVLPGGMPGTLNLGEHHGLMQLLKEQNKRGGKIAAICAAPSILGKMHILRNQQAVCYPGFEDQLEEAFIGKDNVVVSGNIITSRGPGFAVEFGLKIVEILKGSDVAKNVAAGMLLQ